MSRRSPDMTDGSPSQASSRPHSISTTWINLTGLCSFAIALLILRSTAISDAGYRNAILMGAIALPIILLERIFTTVGLRGRFEFCWTRGKILRVATKLVGVLASWLLVLGVFWVFPYFREHSESVLRLVSQLWLPAFILAPFYIWYVDELVAEKKDEYWTVGRLVLGQWYQMDKNVVVNHLREWAVKLFFLQFILQVLTERSAYWLTADFQQIITSHPFGFLDVFTETMYLVDIGFGAVGYLLTLRLFDTHVRTTEPTVLGWLVCLMCYPPFFGAIDQNFLQYNDNLYWSQWLGGYAPLQIFWAALIAVSVAAYALATVQFGIRFGNLSHRGIITNGLYGWLKHPAYVAKNASWWLISIPFVSTSGVSEAVRLSLMLIMLNTIYYLRAKTEERHLSWDPTYLQYSAWIRQHGLWAQMKYGYFAVAEVVTNLFKHWCRLRQRQ